MKINSFQAHQSDYNLRLTGDCIDSKATPHHETIPSIIPCYKSLNTDLYVQNQFISRTGCLPCPKYAQFLEYICLSSSHFSVFSHPRTLFLKLKNVSKTLNYFWLVSVRDPRLFLAPTVQCVLPPTKRSRSLHSPGNFGLFRVKPGANA